MAKARAAVNPQDSFYERFLALIKAAFAYIYEKNAYFQYYTALYRITDNGVKNEILQEMMQMIEDGKAAGDVCAETDSHKAAENIWILTTGISGMLAANRNYRYQDGLSTMLYGVEAIMSYMKRKKEAEG